MIHLHALLSIGDSYYLRPFVKAIAERDGEIAVSTPWPEAYYGINNVTFVLPRGGKLTEVQKKNIRINHRTGVYKPIRNTERSLRLHYITKGKNHIHEEGISILESFRRQTGIQYVDFAAELPPGCDDGVSALMRTLGISDLKKTALVRYPTLREAWRCPARNPAPGSVARCAELLLDRGFQVLSVADIVEGEEWFVDEHRPCTHRLENGVLSFRQLLFLIQETALCLGPPGMFCPVSSALNGASFTVFGHYMSPQMIFDPVMPGLYDWAEPAHPQYNLLPFQEGDKTPIGLLPRLSDFIDRHIERVDLGCHRNLSS